VHDLGHQGHEQLVQLVRVEVEGAGQVVGSISQGGEGEVRARRIVVVEPGRVFGGQGRDGVRVLVGRASLSEETLAPLCAQIQS
jgi:hypothetical protein